jgi:hypothetical protein
MKLKYLLIINLFSVLCLAQTVKDFEQVSDGIKVITTDGTLN